MPAVRRRIFHWGLMVAFASTMVAFLTDGIQDSFGIVLQDLLREFETSVTMLSFTSGIRQGLMLMMGPFSARLVERFGCRSVAFVGGVLASVSIALCTLSVNIEMFIVFYGVMSGLGIGLIYLPSITIINTYFEKKRGLVLGVVTSGSGVGLLIMSMLIEYLVNYYGWRGAYLIIAGIYFHLCFCACVMRPIKRVSNSNMGEEVVKVENVSKYDLSGDADKQFSQIDNKSKASILEKPFLSITDPNGHCISSEDMRAGCSENHEISGSKLTKYDQQQSNENKSPLSNVKYIHDNKMTENLLRTILDHPEKTKTKNIYNHLKSSASERLVNNKEGGGFYSSQPILVGNTNNRPANTSPTVGRKRNHSSSVCHDTTRQNPEGQRFVSSLSSRENLGGSSLSRLFMNIPSECLGLSTASLHINPTSFTKDHEYGYYTRVPGTSHDRLSTTDIDIEVSVLELTPSSPTEPASLCPSFSLLRDPCLVLFCITAFLLQLAASIAPMFAPSYARTLGLDSSQAANIVSVLGISNTMGRLLAGILSFWGTNNLLIYSLGTSLAGALCFAVPLCTSYGSLIAFAVGHGFFIGVFPPLQSIILVELLGLERLPSSFGIICFGKSIASMAGPSIAGGLYQWFEDYAMPFLFAGGVISIANVLHCFLAVLRRRETAKLPSE